METLRHDGERKVKEEIKQLNDKIIESEKKCEELIGENVQLKVVVCISP